MKPKDIIDSIVNTLAREWAWIVSFVALLAATISRAFSWINAELYMGVLSTILLIFFPAFCLKLITSIKELLEAQNTIKPSPFNNILQNGTVYGVEAEKKLVKKIAEAKDLEEEEIYLLQESGASIIDSFTENTKNFLNKKGIMRFVICLPELSCCTSIAMRNCDLDAAIDVKKRIEDAAAATPLQTLVHDHPGQVSIRYCPYPIANTMTIIDPKNKKDSAEMIVRFADFRVEIENKAVIKVSRAEDKDVYEYYYKQYTNYSYYSYKKIFIKINYPDDKRSIINQIIDKMKNESDNYAMTITEQTSVVDLDNINKPILFLDCFSDKTRPGSAFMNKLNIILKRKDIIILAFVMDEVNSKEVKDAIELSFAEVYEYNKGDLSKLLDTLFTEIRKSVSMLKSKEERGF